MLMEHRPLTFEETFDSAGYTLRGLQHLAFITEFTADIRNVCRCDNSVADAISCAQILSLPFMPNFDYVHMVVQKRSDDEMRQLRLLSKSLKFVGV